MSTFRDLITQWRAKAEAVRTYHATMGTGWRVCANELEKALSELEPCHCTQTEQECCCTLSPGKYCRRHGL